jgi:hypothetical protein
MPATKNAAKRKLSKRKGTAREAGPSEGALGVPAEA